MAGAARISTASGALVRQLAGWPAVVLLVVVFTVISMALRDRGFTAVTGYQAIHALLEGNTLAGRKYRFYYHPDGRAVGKVGSHYDMGYWVARDDGYCENWQTWGGGEILCWTLEQRDDVLIRHGESAPRYLDEPVSNRLTIEAGNTLDLVLVPQSPDAGSPPVPPEA